MIAKIQVRLRLIQHKQFGGIDQSDVIVIPSDVVIYRGNAQSVYVASGDVARSVTITTGSGHGGRVVVTSGLKAGDELIVSGNRSLYDGVPVSKNLDFGEDRPL